MAERARAWRRRKTIAHLAVRAGKETPLRSGRKETSMQREGGGEENKGYDLAKKENINKRMD
jgi:hypothetical protein